jgi:hypothetical protein
MNIPHLLPPAEYLSILEARKGRGAGDRGVLAFGRGVVL